MSCLCGLHHAAGHLRAEPGCSLAAAVMLPDVAAACAVVAEAWRPP